MWRWFCITSEIKFGQASVTYRFYEYPVYNSPKGPDCLLGVVLKIKSISSAKNYA